MSVGVSAVVRLVPIALAVFDRQLRYVAQNDRWLDAWKIPRDEASVGRELETVVRDRFADALAACLAGATVRREEPSFRYTLAPIRDGADIGGFVCWCEDLAQQLELRQKLAAHDSMSSDLFEKSPIGLNLCRMDGLWLESNPAFLQLIGYTREEADGGLTYWQLTPRRYDADEARQLEMLRTLRRYGPYEKEFIRKDGSLVPVRLNGFIVERDGQELIWSLIEDITAQRALEAQLEDEHVRAIHASKLATLGEMSATFAHEINNPLQIIGSFVDVLELAFKTRNEEKLRAGFDAIRSATSRAGKIVQGLRKFARDARRDPLEPVTLAHVVEDALVLCRSRVTNHGVELLVGDIPEVPLKARLVELSQVIVNLLNNAFDAARAAPGGWIRVEVAESPSDPTVSLLIEDSGPGVDESMREAIFRSFFTTKRPGEGTGLGLSISRSIVEDHGGTLTLDASSPHTRFVVRLPRAQTFSRATQLV